MPTLVPPNVQQSITALKDALRSKFMSPTRVDYDDRKKKITVIFAGSDDAHRPESMGDLEAQKEKSQNFEKLLGKKHVAAEKTTAAQMPIEYEGRHLKVNSTTFTFDATKLEELLPKRQRSA